MKMEALVKEWLDLRRKKTSFWRGGLNEEKEPACEWSETGMEPSAKRLSTYIPKNRPFERFYWMFPSKLILPSVAFA
jgi:hypothetical protein